MKITTTPESPAVAASETSSEKARPNEMSRELDKELIGSDDESNYTSNSPSSAHSSNYDNGLPHRNVHFRGTTSSASTTWADRHMQRAPKNNPWC